MSYNYNLEELLVLLYASSPTKTDAIATSRRHVEHGLLSVGLKLHCLYNGDQFMPLVNALGGEEAILPNLYRRTDAALCFVLPPVGSARSAIWLLEVLEVFIASRIFQNRNLQIQVCSPGRLNARSGVLLSVGFYLGSDFLRRYTLGDFETTFSDISNRNFCRGRRIVIYDASGMFDREFEWWRHGNGKRVIDPLLPMEGGRSDILTCTSRRDIENVNLIATLLVHAQYDGYWGELGKRFAQDMHEMLDRHLMLGLLDAPWLMQPDWSDGDDDQFFASLKELMAYAFDEVHRLRKAEYSFWKKKRQPNGILWEMRNLLQYYRAELTQHSQKLDRGGLSCE